MKVSTRGRYGLRALVDLAVNTVDAPVPLADIAGRQKISLNYLEQVFGQLRKSGIVRSIKGAGGGYRLAKSAEQITVKEILEVLEGPFSIVESSEISEDPLQRAIRNLVWDEIDRQVNRFLEDTSLCDLAMEYEKSRQKEIMYFI